MPKGVYNHLPLSIGTKEKLRLSHLGKKHSEETKKKMSLACQGRKAPNRYGKHHTIEAREKMSFAIRGANNPAWCGGVTRVNKRIRRGIEFRLWREVVFARDNWTCQKCSERGGELHPHHIKSFAEYPELRFAIDNGITLCGDCHRKLHKWARDGNKREDTEVEEAEGKGSGS